MLVAGCDLVQPQHDFACGRVISGLPAEFETQLEQGGTVTGQDGGFFKRGFGQGGLVGVERRAGEVQPANRISRL